MLPNVGPPRGPLPYPLAEPTSLAAAANLLAFRAAPDGLLCPVRDAHPRPGRGCATTVVCGVEWPVLAGIAAERRDLERLHRDGRIDKAALAAGLEALAMMARTRRLAERHRR